MSTKNTLEAFKKCHKKSRIKNGLLSIAALMLDYNDIVVMCLQLITL